MCSQCLAVKRSDGSRHVSRECPGFSRAFSAILQDPKDHALAVLDCTEGPSLFCLDCARWTDTGARGNLRKEPCPVHKDKESWDKKYKKLSESVLIHRIPPNPRRSREVVHAVYPAISSARVCSQLVNLGERQETAPLLRQLQGPGEAATTAASAAVSCASAPSISQSATKAVRLPKSVRTY